MRRREFIAGLGTAAAWPVVAHAQQPERPVIGILSTQTADDFGRRRRSAFMQGLKETGFVEGQNVAIEFRWANNRLDQLLDLAADLVRRQVSLIFATGNNLSALAAKNATTRIPIVFTTGVDPVQVGLVASIGRPGGNITGVTSLAADQVQKRLQLLHDVVPGAKVFGFLSNPDNAGVMSSNGRTVVELAEETARSLGVTLEVVRARRVADFDAAFASLEQKRFEALATQADALFDSGRERLVALAAQHAIPVVFQSAEAVEAGGLIGYSASITDIYRPAGLYAGRILLGAKPADLPVLLPTKFELAINMKTAKALGLTVSNQLQLLADEVIE